MNRPEPVAPSSIHGYDYGTSKSAISPLRERPVRARADRRLDLG
jgi:hypothetical protein